MAKGYSGDDGNRPNARAKHRAEAYAQRQTGAAEDWEQFIDEATGDIKWEDYVKHKEQSGWKLREDYPYRNKDGITIFTVHRFQYALDPRLKQFPATHEVKGVRKFGTGPLLLPYNLLELIKRPTEPIVLCEGEKAANRAIKDELLATCVHGQHWTDLIADYFTDRDVTVIADNDDMGEENTEKALERLVKVGARPRVLRLPGPRHSDLYDWLEADHTGKELLTAVAQLPVYGKINVAPYVPPQEKDLAPWDWLYGTHLLRRHVSGTAATGGAGKSNLNIAEALAMATGRHLLGHTVPRPLRILLINMEDDSNTMDKRIAAAMRTHKISHDDLGDRLFRVAKDEVEAAFGGRFIIASTDRARRVIPNETLIGALITFLLAHQIDVVIIDPLTLAHEVNESDPGEFRAAIECFGKVAIKANVAISLWHHTRKENGNETTAESARGAKALVDTLRDLRMGEKMPKQECERLKLTDHWRYLRLFSGKVNYAPQMSDSEWYRIESVTLDNNYPFPGESVSAVVSWQHPGTKALMPTSRDLDEIKQRMGNGLDREDVRSSSWAGRGVAEVMGLDQEDDRDQIKKLLKAMARDDRLKTVSRNDKKGNSRSFYVWVNDPE
jgi:AAA domain